MMAYGSQRLNKHTSKVAMRQLLGLCCAVLAYTLFGKRLVNSSYGGLLGREETFEQTANLINLQTMSILFSSCLANSIILIQMTELSSIEADILISIVFGAVIYPTTIAWICQGGWLYN